MKDFYFKNNHIFSNIKKLFFVIGLLVLFLFSYRGNVAHLRLRNAVYGFSPVDYIEIKTNPELAIRRFPNGVEQLKNSYLFFFYEQANKIGISTEEFQHFVIALSILLFIISLLYFSYTILPRAPSEVHFLIILFALTTDLLNHDLARFGLVTSLSLGQMYGFATSFFLLATTAAFKSKWHITWPLIGLIYLFHPATALYTAFTCSAVLLIDLGAVTERKFWYGWFFGIGIAFLWSVFVLKPTLSGSIMSSKDWINWSRFGNAHWYPFSLSVFKEEHFRRITPFLSLFIIGLTSLRYSSFISKEIRKKLLVSFVSLSIMTILGLLASVYILSPSIIKISLHRSSTYILLFSLPLAITLLWDDFTSDSIIKASIALLCLVTPIIGRRYVTTTIIGTWGVPLFFSIFRYELEFFGSFFDSNKKEKNFQLIDFLIQGVTLFAISVFLFLVKQHIALWNHPAFTTQLNLIYIAISTVIILGLIERIGVFNFYIKKIYSYVFILLLLYWGTTSIMHKRITLLPWRNISKAEAYYATQVWARNNTEKSALFMVDPNIDYGWEAYSKRAKFGSFRDLIHTGWLYSGSQQTFEEGMRRIRLFNVEPEGYLNRSIENQKKSVGSEYREFELDVSKTYYTFEGIDLENIAASEGIDYFVFDKRKIKKSLDMLVVYENEHFIIYKAQLERK